MPDRTSPSLATGQDQGQALFSTTRWTLIQAAQGDAETGRAALEGLCRTYWLPVYALVRKRGADPESARDLTQEFFARLLSRDGLASARRERGRFRGFLAQSVRNFLADEWDKARAQKRGGGKEVLSLDAEEAEGRYREAPDELSPDRLFDRQWAERLLEEAGSRLRAEYTAAGRAEVLTVLERIGDPDAPALGAEAQRLSVPANTLKSLVRRARLRQAEIIREVVADTVASPTEVESELRHLLEAYGG